MKKLTLYVHEKANEDFRGIYHYICNDLCNPTAAEELITKIHQGFQQIKEMPLSCPRVRINVAKIKDLRKLVIDNYIVFYRVEEDIVHVIRVIFGMRNYIEILSNNNEND